ncbi:MAG: flagellar biosynthesis protein FlhB [Chitinivibrionales bacterium]|nr:flagellar biosynthesis protein FlhB [Chitinivibrionales bacterium]
MPDEGFQEKSEAPTPKRRSKAREEGDVAKSTEVNNVLILLVGIMALRIAGPWMMREMVGVFRQATRMIGEPPSEMADLLLYLKQTIAHTIRVLMPFALCTLAVGLFANYIQIGFLLSAKPLEPKLDKINPLKGIQRMFALRSVVEALKSVLKIIIIAAVAYATIKGDYDKFLQLPDASVGTIWLFLLDMAFKVIFRIILVLIILAILDYGYQRYEHEKKLKMTKEEIKEETKQMEGDPEVKRRVRSLQREMARRRMMQEVPKATVVVTNPTYIAIALQYEPDSMATPRVVAKGKRQIARRIKDVAAEHAIPIVEDKPLARAMYDRVEPGDDIPLEFFAAVAEILAYVYRLQNRTAA